MSAEWTNALTQIVIAAAQIVLAVAGVYSAFTIWKQQRERTSGVQPKDDEPVKPPIVVRPMARDEQVDQLVELVKSGDEQRSKLFDQYPKTISRAAFRSMAIVFVPSTILSFSLSIIYSRLFPAPGSVIGTTVIGICVLALLVIFWCVFHVITSKASDQIWKDVGDIEQNLEVRLTEIMKETIITPEMLLALHDELLRTIPRVMPPMVNLADGVVISELVRRLNTKYVAA